jgi:hypothetical protein
MPSTRNGAQFGAGGGNDSVSTVAKASAFHSPKDRGFRPGAFRFLESGSVLARRRSLLERSSGGTWVAERFCRVGWAGRAEFSFWLVVRSKSSKEQRPKTACGLTGISPLELIGIRSRSPIRMKRPSSTDTSSKVAFSQRMQDWRTREGTIWPR